MSFNNQVVLVGSLGADSEMRFTNGGIPILSFRMATAKKWKDKQSGAQKEETQWHSCVLFGDRATELQPHLHKGSYVRVEGEVTYEQWEKDGVKHYATKIRAEHVGPAAFPRSQDTSSAAAPAHTEPPTYNGNAIPFGTPPSPQQTMAKYGDFQY
jgi:single stranded DNA-binding protein